MTKPTDGFSTVARVPETVAYPGRLAIIELLEHAELSVNEVGEALGAKHSITSPNLNLMGGQRRPVRSKRGSKVFYGIRNEAVIKLLDCIYRNCEDVTGKPD